MCQGYRERVQLYKQGNICRDMFTWSNKMKRHSATSDIACQTNYETDYRSKTLVKRGRRSFLYFLVF